MRFATLAPLLTAAQLVRLSYNSGGMDLDTAETLSYLWQPLGTPIGVSLGLNVVDRLEAAVREGAQSDPHRGIEVGGLLLGSTRRVRDRTVVEIEDFEPVDCEHAVGPSYMLTAADRRTLERQIRAHKSRRPSVVGFYRSHTRKELAITVEDIDLMSDYFAQASQVFLVIHAHRERTATAGFVIWEGRSVRSTRPYLEFPFRRADLMEGGYVIRRSQAPAARPLRAERARTFPRWDRLGPALRVMLRTPAARGSRTPQEAANPGGSRQWKALLRLGGIAAAAILLGLLPAVVFRSGPRASPPVPPSSTPSPPAAEAPVVAKDTAPPATTAEAQVIAPPDALARGAAGAPPPVARIKKEYRARAASILPTTTTLSERAAPPPSPPLPEAPPVSAEVAGGAAPVPAASQILTPAPQQIAEPFVSVSMSPVRQQTRGLLSKLPLIHKRRKESDFVPPSAVREAQPEIPAALREQVTNETAIDVKVTVDREGKVAHAELLSKGSRPNRDLAGLAVASALRWEFSPAHSGDEAVPAVVVLRFRFAPETR